MTRHFLAALLLAAASGAACAQAGADPAGQAIFDQIVLTSGAANGAARTCGASAPDLAQHAETWRLNLRRYAVSTTTPSIVSTSAMRAASRKAPK
ncbi:hypothetical protein L535_1374 [Bordetella bronchiseptica SBL-F6116]|nr:hypothetical protein L535_1374 [Bordetella bronchiseptica SBL-F6116]